MLLPPTLFQELHRRKEEKDVDNVAIIQEELYLKMKSEMISIEIIHYILCNLSPNPPFIMASI